MMMSVFSSSMAIAQYSSLRLPPLFFFFFFNDTATTEIYTLSLHDALPISASRPTSRGARDEGCVPDRTPELLPALRPHRRSRAGARLGDGVLARLGAAEERSEGLGVPRHGPDVPSREPPSPHVPGAHSPSDCARGGSAGRGHLHAWASRCREGGCNPLGRAAVYA